LARQASDEIAKLKEQIAKLEKQLYGPMK